MANIVEQATKAAAKRITYGIEIKVDNFTFNEWGLHESQAKEVHDMLTTNGDKPITLGNITFTRRAPSELSAALAELKTKLVPPSV